METVERREETVRFDDPAVLADLFGSQDDHLRIVEKSLGVTILPKGNALNVIGDPLQVEGSDLKNTPLNSALPSSPPRRSSDLREPRRPPENRGKVPGGHDTAQRERAERDRGPAPGGGFRSEEHTAELRSPLFPSPTLFRSSGAKTTT